MYAVVRRYQFDRKSAGEIDRKVREGFAPLIRKTPGFVAYYWVNTGEGVGLSLSVFKDKAGTEESVRLAADYVKNNLAGLLGTPETTQGEGTSERLTGGYNAARAGKIRAALSGLTGRTAVHGPGGRGNAQHDLTAYANGTKLPVGVVAFLDNEICGVAALKSESISTHSLLSPWAAAAMVQRDHRGRGIGTELIRAIEQEAKRRGYSQIYCGTSTAMHLLDRRGWRLMEHVAYDGDNVSIYAKAL